MSYQEETDSVMNIHSEDSEGSGEGAVIVGFDHNQRRLSRANSAPVDNIANDDTSSSSSPNPNSNALITDDSAVDSQQKEDDESDDEYSQLEDGEEEEDEDTKWSVRIRILSAVDLPPNSLPIANTPLCPVVKFGVLTMEDDATNKNNHKQQRRHFQKAVDLSHSSLIQSSSSSANDTNYSYASIKQTSFTKTTTSTHDNRSMEWQEDVRFDGVTLPLQTVLIMELNARALLNFLTSSPKENGGSVGSNKAAMLVDDYNSLAMWYYKTTLNPIPYSMNSNEDNNQQSEQTDSTPNTNNDGRGGILSLWRKGRQTLSRRGRNQSFNGFTSAQLTNPSVANNNNNNNNYNNNNDGSMPLTNSPVSSSENISKLNAAQKTHMRKAGSMSNIALTANRPPSPDKSEMEAASAAAAVARFLMEGEKPPDRTTTETSSEFGGTSVGEEEEKAPLVVNTANNDNTELTSILDEIWDSKSDLPSSKTTSNRQRKTNVSAQASAKVLQDDTSPYSTGDLKLGNLIFSLADLPLEEECPKVEKWFPLQTDALSLLPLTGNGDDDDETESAPTTPATPGSRPVSGSDYQTPTTNAMTHRAPSVLLEISLYNARTLDEVEEKSYTDLNSSLTDNNNNVPEDEDFGKRSRSNTATSRNSVPGAISPSSSASQPIPEQSRETTMKQQQKLMLEEKEAIRQNGPFLNPGIVDYVCVVGAKNLGDLKGDDGTRGWIEPTGYAGAEMGDGREGGGPECGILEQFPNDDFHSKHGR